MPMILKKVSAFGAYEIFNWVFNNPAYMLAVGYLGLWQGGLLMAMFSLVQCAIFLVMFDKMGVDWVGANYLEEVRRKTEKKWWERLISWAARKEGGLGILSFIVYSIFVDPFVVAVHYRRRQFSGINKRDWLLLFSSVFIGNLYWTLRTGVLVEAIKWAWEKI